MQPSAEKVEFTYIDLSVSTFSCSSPAESPALAESIQRVGMLKPITLVEQAGKYVVVSGLRRARAVKRLGHSTVKAIILKQPAPGDMALFCMNLEDNLATRPLNSFEKAIAVKRMATEFNVSAESDIVKQYIKIFGLSPEPRVVDRQFALAGLDDKIKEFILDRGWSDRYADAFLSLGVADSLALLGVAERLHLTAGHLKELGESVGEIAQAQGVSLPEVLEKLEKTDEPDEGNSNQKRDAFINRLRKERFPAYSEASGAMESALASINKTKGVSVQAPPYLEGDTFTASLSFKTPEELLSRAEALLEFGRSDQLTDAVSILG